MIGACAPAAVVRLRRVLRLDEQRLLDPVEPTVPGRELPGSTCARAAAPSCVVRVTANRPATAATARTSAMTNTWMRLMSPTVRAPDKAPSGREGKSSVKPLQGRGRTDARPPTAM